MIRESSIFARKMKLSIGFSPCPNDTFIFDAMVHGKIDTLGLTFDVTMGDVEELNQLAFRSDLAITKLSYHALGHLLDDYRLLDAGSALGRNCGPLLIAKEGFDPADITKAKIAIPGRYTTANFLLSMAYPEVINKKELLFSDIENAVLSNEVDVGLIIHENRFTYRDKGLKKLIDLGEFWEGATGLPIPLGGIVIRKEIDFEIKKKVNDVLRRSIEYAMQHPEESLPFIKENAQEMDPAVMYAHIDLYVNDYSLNLGKEGKKAVKHLFQKATEMNIIPKNEGVVFWND